MKKIKNRYVIGIDNGYGYIKTKNSIAMNGIEKLAGEPPMMNNILKHQGSYYGIGQSRLPYMADKTANHSHYLGTLAAIARELKTVNDKTNTGDIVIAAGLPYSFYYGQKEQFREYLMADAQKNINFSFNQLDYNIKIAECYVYPQAFTISQYPEVFMDGEISKADIKNLKEGRYIVCDVGSGTIDMITMQKGVMLGKKSKSIPEAGTIGCVGQINDAFLYKYNYCIDESLIQDFMQGNKKSVPESYRGMMEELMREYVNGTMLEKISQNGVNFAFDQVVFCGGGARLIKEFGTYNKELTHFVTNLHFNAAGYEELAAISEGAK